MNRLIKLNRQLLLSNCQRQRQNTNKKHCLDFRGKTTNDDNNGLKSKSTADARNEPTGTKRLGPSTNNIKAAKW